MEKSYIDRRIGEEIAEARLNIPYEHREVITQLGKNIKNLLRIHNKL